VQGDSSVRSESPDSGSRVTEQRRRENARRGRTVMTVQSCYGHSICSTLSPFEEWWGTRGSGDRHGQAAHQASTVAEARRQRGAVRADASFFRRRSHLPGSGGIDEAWNFDHTKSTATPTKTIHIHNRSNGHSFFRPDLGSRQAAG
jgi:hypothetical protein